MTNQTVSDFCSSTGKSDRTCRNHRQKLEQAYGIELVERRGSQYFVVEPYTALWLASLHNDVLPAAGDDLEVWCNDYSSSDARAEPESEVMQGEIEIHHGNDINFLPQPEFSTTRTLNAIAPSRFNAQSYADPMALVEQARRTNNQIIQAMGQQLDSQQQILNATTAAALEFDAENQRIADAAEQYRIENAVQRALIGQQSQVVQRKYEQQQALGKSPAGSPSPQS